MAGPRTGPHPAHAPASAPASAPARDPTPAHAQAHTPARAQAHTPAHSPATAHTPTRSHVRARFPLAELGRWLLTSKDGIHPAGDRLTRHLGDNGQLLRLAARWATQTHENNAISTTGRERPAGPRRSLDGSVPQVGCAG